MDVSINELLTRLQSCDESCHIEAKESRSALGKSARETISAFCNEPDLGGGYLILGSKRIDQRYVITGIQNPDKVQCELANACRQEFSVRLSPKIRVEQVNGKTLIVAYIPEACSREKPVYIKSFGLEKGSFRRIGSADHRCTSHDLDLLFQLRSNIPYEKELLPDGTWEDIDSDAISTYRRKRKEVDPEAAELALDDQELLASLRCLVRDGRAYIPNIAGLLLFGTKRALRRMMPSEARVDYVITGGPEWVGNPSARHFSIDYRESLITLLPKLHAEIMGDLPKLFGLKTGELQRTDTPIIPGNVIREALSNAMMHRDYRVAQPTLVIRYSNRLELKNAGYSLKPFEELGQSGSRQRNPIIASVFHELKYAENKGTGIASIKTWMKEAGLTTPPIIETNRESNEFDLVLLPHHLVDKQDLEWLTQFAKVKLSDAERRALVLTREMGAITNQDYRQINGMDTLGASKALVHLRDLELLTMKGSGNRTYYILSNLGRTPHISAINEGLTPHISAINEGFKALPEGFPPLSKELINELKSLKTRTSPEKVRRLIKALCSIQALQLAHLSKIFDRAPRYLRDKFLTKMIKAGELSYKYPDQPAHPKQAYITQNEGE
ncbi:MAG: ATP-binding protein [Candidatus Algichlamydia australiensis]|nr:ATP-binding protein [Chlamydiales bacterium]